MAIGPNPPNDEITEQHLMFGTVKVNGEWRPVLQRQATEEDACTECRGFGTGGCPLVGAVYTCKACEGTGLRQPGQPLYVPEEKRSETEPVEAPVTCPPNPWWWAAIIVAVTLAVLVLA